MGILIKNGTVVSATESRRLDVLVSGEMIARVGEDDYITYEPPLQAHVQTPAKVPVAGVVRRDVKEPANQESRPGVVGV